MKLKKSKLILIISFLIILPLTCMLVGSNSNTVQAKVLAEKKVKVYLLDTKRCTCNRFNRYMKTKTYKHIYKYYYNSNNLNQVRTDQLEKGQKLYTSLDKVEKAFLKYKKTHAKYLSHFRYNSANLPLYFRFKLNKKEMKIVKKYKPFDPYDAYASIGFNDPNLTVLSYYPKKDEPYRPIPKPRTDYYGKYNQ